MIIYLYRKLSPPPNTPPPKKKQQHILPRRQYNDRPHLSVQWLSLGKTKQTTAVCNSVLTFSINLLNLEREMHNDEAQMS